MRRDRRDADSDLVAVVGVLDGVRDEVEHRLDQAIEVGLTGDHSRTGRLVDDPDPRREPGRALQEVVGEVAVVDGLEPQEVRLLRLGEHQQVSDRSAHPAELVEHDGHRLLALDRVVAERLEVALGDGERGPQIVGDVVEELSLGAESAVQPLHHLVERGPQLRQLATSADGDARRQVGVRHRPSGQRQLAHRGDDPAGERPHEAGGDDEHDEPGEDEQADEVGQLLVVRVHEVRDDEHAEHPLGRLEPWRLADHVEHLPGELPGRVTGRARTRASPASVSTVANVTWSADAQERTSSSSSMITSGAPKLRRTPSSNSPSSGIV